MTDENSNVVRNMSSSYQIYLQQNLVDKLKMAENSAQVRKQKSKNDSYVTKSSETSLKQGKLLLKTLFLSFIFHYYFLFSVYILMIYFYIN